MVHGKRWSGLRSVRRERREGLCSGESTRADSFTPAVPLRVEACHESHTRSQPAPIEEGASQRGECMTEELTPTVGISYAARRLAVSETRVRQLIEQGKLQVCRKDNGNREIKRESLEKLVAQRKQ